MVQSAKKQTPLGIDAFWDKPTPNSWGKRRVQYKLALLAKENIILDTLLGTKPEMLELSLEPIYGETIVGSSAQPLMQYNTHPVLAPQISITQTTSKYKRFDHHHYTAPIVGHHGFLDIAISALPKVKLVTTVVC